MKKEILDSPFLDSSPYAFEDILQEGEGILWKGKPLVGERKLFTLLDYALLGLVLFVLFYFKYFPPEFWTFAIIGMILFGSSLYQKINKITKMRGLDYAITPTKVIWSYKRFSERETYAIDFKDIKWVDIEDDAIFIKVKNADLVVFDTTSHKTLEKRTKPTFENIENIEAVAEQMEKLIQQNTDA